MSKPGLDVVSMETGHQLFLSDLHGFMIVVLTKPLQNEIKLTEYR